MKTVLCPTPASQRQCGDAFEAPRVIATQCADPALSRATDVAAAFTGRISGAAINPDAPFNVAVTSHAALAGEAYALKIDRTGCTIRAGAPEGVTRAFSTLAQLLINGQIQALEIEDKPSLSVRGYMLDISRDRVAARRTLLYILDALWLLKYNQFQLYTEHTFAFAGHQKVWGAASPLNALDIKWLEDQCEARGIELVPNFNSLGHFGRWLQHPEYQYLSECPDGCTLPNGRVMPVGGTTLYPCPDTLAFLGSLYGELLPLFKSRQFNAGMDEPWEMGLGRSKSLCERVGKHRVYLDHLSAVARLAEKHGKSLQFWADIVLEAPQYVAELPPGITGMIWGYEAGHPFEAQCAAFEKAQVPFIVCPGTTGWNSLCGRWENARANIVEAARAAVAHHAKGILLTDWGDNGHHQPPCVSLPPLALAADAAWNGTVHADIADTINVLLARDSTGITGRALTALGSAAERHFKTRIHNTSPAWKMFFATPEELPGILTAEDAAQLPAFRQDVARLRAELQRAKPSAFGRDLVAMELDLAARMLDYGAWRTQKALDIAARKPDSIERIADDFEELWLQRSERGGLPESLARIRSIQ
jgi:hexosaminidase